MRRRVLLVTLAPGEPCAECGTPIAREAHVQIGSDALCGDPDCRATHRRRHREYRRWCERPTYALDDLVARVARGA